MEYENFRKKEKIISVHISKGQTWKEVRSGLCYHDNGRKEKRSHRNKLILDILIKREFRPVTKDESWVKKLKSAISNRVVSKSSSYVYKRDVVDKDHERNVKRERQKKDGETNNLESKKLSRSIYSKGILPMIPDSNDRCQRYSKTSESKKTSETVFKKTERKTTVSTNESELICQDASVKIISRKNQKKQCENLSNFIASLPVESEKGQESEPVSKKRQFIKNIRSKSKPSTTLEKRNDQFIKGISDFSSVNRAKGAMKSITTLRAVEAGQKVTEPTEVTACFRKRANQRKDISDRKDKIHSCNFDKQLQSDEKKDELYNARLPKEIDNVNARKTKFNTVKKIGCEPKIKDLKKMENIKEDKCNLKNRNFNTRIRFNLSSNSYSDDDCVHKTPSGEAAINDTDDEIRTFTPLCSSSSNENSSKSSVMRACQCGCMDTSFSSFTAIDRIDSSSSSSSIDYLRSYSGNLVMCAHGKKPILDNYIRYLSTSSKV